MFSSTVGYVYPLANSHLTLDALISAAIRASGDRWGGLMMGWLPVWPERRASAYLSYQ